MSTKAQNLHSNHDVLLSAPLPPLVEKSIQKLYPKDLILKLVQIVHRHGERTPIKPELTEHVPALWPNCHYGSFLSLHSSLKGGSTQSPSPAGIPDSQEQLQGKGSILPHAHAQLGSMYRKVAFDTSLWGDNTLSSTGKDEGAKLVHGVCYYGQLTDLGRERMENLGKRLRELYIERLGLLKPKLESEAEIFVRSTDYPRTLESVHSVLQGLYPPSARAMGNHVHIYTRTPPTSDNMYPDWDCQRYMKIKKEFEKANKSILREKVETSGKTVKELIKKGKNDIVVVSDILASALAHDIPLRNLSLTKSDIAQVHSLACQDWWSHLLADPDMPKLSIGRFVHEIGELISDHLQQSSSSKFGLPKWFAVKSSDNDVGSFKKNYSMHWNRFQEGETKLPPKLAIYSGHDTTVAPLLMALGVWDMHWPPFGSNVTFELFQHSSKPQDHYVRLKYNQLPLTVPECARPDNHYEGDTSLCKVNVFLEMMKKVAIPLKEYKNVCSTPVP